MFSEVYSIMHITVLIHVIERGYKKVHVYIACLNISDIISVWRIARTSTLHSCKNLYISAYAL